jgi:hypothetical protein
MDRSFVDRAALTAFIADLDAVFACPGNLYLVGETTHVFEGWVRWTEQVRFTADVAATDQPDFAEAVRTVGARMGIAVLEESPADVIPLPEGYGSRARPAGRMKHLELYHFDPYSVAFRYIARGDEPDYHLVLTYLTHGWMTLDEMDALLNGLLPRFSFATIQQDPAEFRRRYKGLLQMRQAVPPGTIHRFTPA